MSAEAKKVVVVGAGGRTGALVLEKLLARPDEFITRGVVRASACARACALLCATLGPPKCSDHTSRRWQYSRGAV